MLETNGIIIDFLANNCVGLGMIFALLKIIASATENVVDDKIVTLFKTWVPGRKTEKPVQTK